MAPATQPIMGGELTAVGVNVTDRTKDKQRPILPQNFLIDPVATNEDNALGVAVDEFVSRHLVEELQESGVYADVYVGNAPRDYELEPDQELSSFDDDKVRLTKYYGKVPRHLLMKSEKQLMMQDGDEDIAEIETLVEDDDETTESFYVEAIIVIANGGILLKAEENPYMMGDRPIVAFLGMLCRDGSGARCL